MGGARGRSGLRAAAVGAAACLALSGCASGPDPFEPLNRAIFGFNEAVDTVIFTPLANVYEAIVPGPIRGGINNFFTNLTNVGIAINDLLQGKPDKAGEDMLRFGANVALGFGGIYDVASGIGLERREEDFGQTLGVWGFDEGPYLVLPLFGPSTVRDAFGLPVRLATDPVTYVGGTTIPLTARSVRAVDERSAAGGALERREEAAIDKYIFTREAYLQRRRFLVHDGDPPVDVDELDLELEEFEDEEEMEQAAPESGAEQEPAEIDQP